MAYNTNNPVGSTDPRDLYDNAENLDKLVNGPDPFYADRLGKLRYSWSGMEVDFVNAQEGRETAFTVSQADKESRFQAFLVSSGYVSKGDYAAGVVLAERNEYVAVSAATTGTSAGLYRPNASATLPLTLTGAWATDAANLVLLGDDVLRQDLANGKSALVDSAVVGWRERTVADRLSDTVNIKDFGAVGDGVADDSAAFEAARDAGVSIFLPVGTYLITRPIVFTNGAVIHGEGDASVIDCSGAGFVGSYALDVSGTLTQIANVDALSKGAYTVTFLADPGLQPGDVFVLYNPTDSSFSAFRTNYRAGEFCEVRTVSGNTVTLTNPLYSGYPAGSIQVYKLQSGPVLLRNFRIIGKNAVGNIRISKCLRPTVADVSSFHHAGSSGVYFDKCFRPQFINPNVHLVGGGGDDYGVIFGNCQHGGVVGGSVYSRRHAIATGGDAAVGCVPCRDLRMRGVVLKNDIQAGTHCADFHGNAEDCSYENCTIYGGITWQGKDIAYRNCTITNMLNGILCYSAELIGGEYLIENCRMISSGDPQPGGRGLIDVGGNSIPLNANTQSAVEFRVRGGTLSAMAATSFTSGLVVRVRGSSVPVRIDVKGLDVTVPNLNALVFCDVLSGSVGAGSWISIDDLSGLPIGGRLASVSGGFETVPMRMPRTVGSKEVTTSTNSNIVSASVTFRYTYPKVPVLLCSKSASSYHGNRIGVTHASSVTTTGATLSLATDDATNFAAAVTCTLNYEAVLDEV
jgi:hypothetical protein